MADRVFPRFILGLILVWLAGMLVIAGLSLFDQPSEAQVIRGESVQVVEESPTSGFTFQLALSGSADQFPNNPCKSITVYNPSGNGTVYIGFTSGVSSSTGDILEASHSKSIAIDNSNRVWAIGTAAQKISVIGVN